MKQEINAIYTAGMSFNIDVQGYKITVDATPDSGGNNMGPTPKPLLLASLAGCTGMDVVAILKKMQVTYDSLTINVVGDTVDEHPKKFTQIHLIYTLKGTEIDREKVEKAVNLSQDKYCGVAATLKDAVKLSYEIIIND